MTVTAKKMRTYKREKDNYIIVKVPGGYNVTNTGTMKMYQVEKTGDQVTCSCPDWKYRGSETGEACKHMIAVRKNHDNKKAIDIQKAIARW